MLYVYGPYARMYAQIKSSQLVCMGLIHAHPFTVAGIIEYLSS